MRASWIGYYAQINVHVRKRYLMKLWQPMRLKAHENKYVTIEKDHMVLWIFKTKQSYRWLWWVYAKESSKKSKLDSAGAGNIMPLRCTNISRRALCSQPIDGIYDYIKTTEILRPTMKATDFHQTLLSHKKECRILVSKFAKTKLSLDKKKLNFFSLDKIINL